MTWRHRIRKDKQGALMVESFICDLECMSVLIDRNRLDMAWRISTSDMKHVFDIEMEQAYPTAEEAMTAVEERLASFAQDLLSDALGVRRIQEAK